jgi:hypothetical protein
MDSQKKIPGQMFMVWMSISAPLLYMGICELICRTSAVEFKGYATLAPNVYPVVKMAAIFISVVMAAVAIKTRMDISSGNISVFSRTFLKNMERSGASAPMMAAQSLLVLIAFCCNIAVIGLALFFMNGVRADSYPLMAVSMIMMLLFWPTNGLTEKVEALNKNRV